MHCPKCLLPDAKVIDSRHLNDGQCTRRRRKCGSCNYRFTTYEHIQNQMPVVAKNDGRREDFDRNKILKGLEKAFEKRPISRTQIEELIDNVAKEILDLSENEISSNTIGEFVMEQIYRLDRVAFIRFASFYWNYDDIDDFITNLKSNLEFMNKTNREKYRELSPQ